MLQHNFKYLLIILIATIPHLSFSQIGLEEEEYENELTVGINTNSNGGLLSGFNFKYLHKRTPKKWDLYSLEIVNVKHEKEIRLSSNNSSSFFPGKTNYLFSIRPSYGKEINLFQKYPEDGVRVNFSYSGGPTIGLLKPYFIEYNFIVNGDISTRTVAYDPAIHRIERINGDAGLLFGLTESTPKLGAHLRTSLNFEYGPVPDMMIGIEAGATFEGFASEIILNQNNQNRQLYSAFFLQLYYGYRF